MFNNIKKSIENNKIKLNDINNTNDIDIIQKKIKLLGLYDIYYNIEKVNNNDNIYDIYCYITEKYENNIFSPVNEIFPFILFEYNEKYNYVTLKSFVVITKKEKLFLDSSRIIYINVNSNHICDYKITPVFRSYNNKKNIDIIKLIDIIFNSKPKIYIDEIYLI